MQWKSQDSSLLQYAIYTLIMNKVVKPDVEMFELEDWELVANKYFMGTRTGKQCRKRWLFI
jgi:Myb-like DNA-binding domain